jgi:hypothetical protein
LWLQYTTGFNAVWICPCEVHQKYARPPQKIRISETSIAIDGANTTFAYYYMEFIFAKLDHNQSQVDIPLSYYFIGISK